MGVGRLSSSSVILVSPSHDRPRISCIDNLFVLVLLAVLGGDSSNMDSNGVSTALTRLDDATVRKESKTPSLLKSVSSSSLETPSRASASELASVDARSPDGPRLRGRGPSGLRGRVPCGL